MKKQELKDVLVVVVSQRGEALFYGQINGTMQSAVDFSKGNSLTLYGARRILSWDIETNGITGFCENGPNKAKICDPVKEIFLIGVVGIFAVSKKAKEKIEAQK